MGKCKECIHKEVCIAHLKDAMKGMGFSYEDEVIETGLNQTRCEFFKDVSKFKEGA